jgi:hypothetical protein
MFGETAVSQVNMHRRSKGTHEPTSFFGVGGSALASEPGESRVRLNPLTFCSH